MEVDVLVAEIGSTTTLINAFQIHGKEPKFLGRGVHNTTVEKDVTIGLENAIKDLAKNLRTDNITYKEMFATSSAAGGLKVSVHGLVYEMTVRASKEAALNAGANIHLVTAGKIRKNDLYNIVQLKPNMIIVAGGTDYGERDTALYNMREILKLNLNIPIIYAGNIENIEEIEEMFKNIDKRSLLKVVENVYPRVDLLNILPLRKVIYETFEENIVHAKGMNKIHNIVNQKIMPTPGSVMESSMILREEIGNLITIDVGGATTDVHSIANTSDDFKEFQEGEPLSKRSVEGDLGVFINHKNVIEMIGKSTLKERIGVQNTRFDELLSNYSYIPKNEDETSLVYELTKFCTHRALDRHVGDLKKVYTSSGQKIIPEGKDLTQVENIILTGGALINLNDTEKIVQEYIKRNPTKLLPDKNVHIYRDHDYIMASVGVLSLKYPYISLKLLLNSLRLD
jgi:uncharacterized protein (TIGR01319 family)